MSVVSPTELSNLVGTSSRDHFHLELFGKKKAREEGEIILFEVRIILAKHSSTTHTLRKILVYHK